ncbi:YxD-tail cyclophane-containing RiPP peptide [Streptomyces sp. NBC_00989]|uniref:YxD-tail cyclophane-containing RiPP peptide n=1 Tax=Streptomyces sp. NBC_00989 TaxID=2903705 RepID=UPI0038654DE8|nr:hypothetical protein OG714_13520 [Streptomyces sp. NBC_00989]
MADLARYDVQEYGVTEPARHTVDQRGATDPAEHQQAAVRYRLDGPDSHPDGPDEHPDGVREPLPDFTGVDLTALRARVDHPVLGAVLATLLARSCGADGGLVAYHEDSPGAER